MQVIEVRNVHDALVRGMDFYTQKILKMKVETVECIKQELQ
jgi:hypothetical protein